MTPVLRGILDVLLVMQTAQASIVGTVRDEETLEPLAGVVVALPDLNRSAETGADGRYVLSAVPAGPQHVTVRQIGYADRTLHALVPREGQLEINFTLSPRPIPLERVDVRPRLALRGSETGPHGERWVSMAAVRNHPLLAEPDPFLALGGGEVVSLPETPTGLHIRGGASDQTAWLIDGIPVLSPYHAAGLFSAWNADALARVELHAEAPPSEFPSALSGVVSAVTRPAGPRLGMRGTLSTTQASVTADGPVGDSGAGWLISLRSGFPDALAPRESSYLHGETADWLAKVDAPLLGGTVTVLGYENENELDTAADVSAPEPSASGATGGAQMRNRFGWRSRSFGATWRGATPIATLRLAAWHASSAADAVWRLPADATALLASGRREEGVLVAFDRTSVSVGLRFRRSRTDYRILSGGADDLADIGGSTPIASAFIEHSRALARGLGLEIGAAVTAASGSARVSPRARLSWSPVPDLVLRASVSRLHQFEQSLRNPESVVGTVFPTELFINADVPGASVARSDQAVLAAELRRSGWRIGAQAWARVLDGLTLVAPVDGEPFSTGAFVTGSGRAHGASFDASFSGSRFGALAGWGWRQVRLAHGAGEYVPAHGIEHDIQAGLIVFPSPTASVRLGATGLLGRRTTPVPGSFEWESCNLLDGGCEFAGSPHYGDTAPGSAELPAYLRIDLGVRKHWHVRAMGRDAMVALTGTLTNLIGRGNTLTWSADPLTGERVGMEMRPRAPLVIGLDWRF